MSSVDPVYLDLDAVESPVDFTVKFKGVEHKVVETSVSDFIATARAIESLSVDASVEKELEVSISIIHRCLPTIAIEDLQTLKLSQLQRIKDFVMTANGEKAEETQPAGEGASGNAPKAN
ncbi:hypothetical protein B7L88_gp011 [Rhizobium phage RHEph10]|uniref:hypothetical protein n=1 Tax=Rhizobium phage RHEph10 TaxID=1220717 RepID=UPI0002AB06B0|nr:hypothetical protein B7L88_gp011 [Rhizobium phage RHEph10]AGC36055.1 hypothetical protein RHEph10_gp011 [Rhizobium phage RHEph10]